MENSELNSRDKKIAAARRKLKKFKKKRTNADTPTKDDASLSNNSAASSKTSSTLSLYFDNYLEVKQNHDSEESGSIAETDEISTIRNGVSTSVNADVTQPQFNDDASNTMENILELSAKLQDIAIQAKSLEEKKEEEVKETTSLANKKEKDDKNEEVVNKLKNENKSMIVEVQKLKRVNDSLTNTIEEKKLEMENVKKSLQQEKEQIYSYGTKQQSMLQEQIQVQMQTIGVLVSEKQDLQQQAIMMESKLKQVTMKSENSGSEMQTLNKKRIMLQRDLTEQTEINTAFEKKIQDLNKDKLDLDGSILKLKESVDDGEMQKKELLQKLRMKEMNYSQLNGLYRELQEKFGMAEILLQQMQVKNETNEEEATEQEEMQHLQRRLDESQHAITELTVERDRMRSHHADERKQMQEQIDNLVGQMSALEDERNELVGIQQMMQTRVQSNVQETSIKQEIEQVEQKENVAAIELRQQLTTLMSAHEALQSEFNETIHNNEQLSRIIQDKEVQIGELSNHIEQLNSEQQGHSKLLEETRGDKTAISRALAQNKQLKNQLEEIQDGFVKLSNDKMDLATQLNTAEHINRDVLHRLDDFGQTIKENNQTILSKDVEIEQLRTSMQQLHDSLQHSPVEAQSNFLVVESLQSQLDASQETVNLLREQNNNLKGLVATTQADLESAARIESELRVELNKWMEMKTKDHPKHADNETHQQEHEEESSNKDVIIEAVDETQEVVATETDEVETEAATIQHEDVVSSEFVTQEEHKLLQQNMALLQDRFTKAMNKNAELENKLEILQHLNTQLENECGTIGEYISLYHDQRQILRQRHQEKDEYISTISREREAMQGKVDQLQALVLRLLNKNEADFSNISIATQDNTSQHSVDLSQTDSLLSSSDVISVSETQSATSDLVPMSEKEQEKSVDGEAVVGKAKRLRTTSDNSDIGETAEKIIDLLSEMQKPGDPAMFDPNLIPSGFCMRYKGRYTAI